MKKESLTDYERLDAMTDEEIEAAAWDDPDAQPTDEAFWADAELVIPKEPKTPIHIRIDSDVLRWFKSFGPGYQSRINEVLETYVKHKKERSAKVES
ncbi:MAG: 3-oxoacyl-ACP synthase [Desulfovibrio sp.]|nr:MAG: 3-oxoacyl-ACP synthase [Desulfovibrio sp.]